MGVTVRVTLTANAWVTSRLPETSQLLKSLLKLNFMLNLIGPLAQSPETADAAGPRRTRAHDPRADATTYEHAHHLCPLIR